MSTAPQRVVLHPSRPPGVLDAARDLQEQGLITLVEAGSDDEVAAALAEPGSVLVSHVWRDDFRTDGLAWVQVLAAGVERFPLAELTRRDVPVCNARGVATGAIAEHAFAMLLAMTREILGSHDDQRAHRWVQRIAADVSGRTLALIGLGAIGQQIAARARAFGMTVLGVRRRPDPVPHVDELVGLDEACARAQVLITCLPGGDETRGLIGAAQLAALGDGWVLNVGRGGVIDEDALLAALSVGALRGAALDVVDGEPLAADSPLWDAPNLLLTGHSAALSPRWGAEWAALFVRNLAAARGEGAWASRVG